MSETNVAQLPLSRVCDRRGMGHLLGYAPISTTDQQPHLQVDALERAGCYRRFTETASGARTDRAVLEQLLGTSCAPATPWWSGAGPAGPVAAPPGRHRQRTCRAWHRVSQPAGVDRHQPWRRALCSTYSPPSHNTCPGPPSRWQPAPAGRFRHRDRGRAARRETRLPRRDGARPGSALDSRVGWFTRPPRSTSSDGGRPRCGRPDIGCSSHPRSWSSESRAGSPGVHTRGAW
jgi:hypothetical protein